MSEQTGKCNVTLEDFDRTVHNIREAGGSLCVEVSRVCALALDLLKPIRPLVVDADCKRRVVKAGWRWKEKAGTVSQWGIEIRRAWPDDDQNLSKIASVASWPAAAAYAEANEMPLEAEPDEPTLNEKFDAASRPGLLGVPTIGVSAAIAILKGHVEEKNGTVAPEAEWSEQLGMLNDVGLVVLRDKLGAQARPVGMGDGWVPLWLDKEGEAHRGPNGHCREPAMRRALVGWAQAHDRYDAVRNRIRLTPEKGAN